MYGMCGGSCGCDDCGNGNGLGGISPFMGDFLDTATMVSQFDPTGTSQLATGIAQGFKSAWDALEGVFNIGAGRKEADLLAPIQNQIGQRLAEINNGINAATITQLQRFWDEVATIGREYTLFAMDPKFTEDGDYRASTGALNTIMPLIDGTDADGNQVRADRGTLGTIERRLIAMGGTISQPNITQGYGSSIVPTLRQPIQNYPYIPQAGTLPPVSPLSPIRATLQPSAGMTDYLPIAIAAGLALTFLSRRR
jgi:hypothetical protein